jgi:hypothetical protein
MVSIPAVLLHLAARADRSGAFFTVSTAAARLEAARSRLTTPPGCHMGYADLIRTLQALPQDKQAEAPTQPITAFFRPSFRVESFQPLSRDEANDRPCVTKPTILVVHGSTALGE